MSNFIPSPYEYLLRVATNSNDAELTNTIEKMRLFYIHLKDNQDTFYEENEKIPISFELLRKLSLPFKFCLIQTSNSDGKPFFIYKLPAKEEFKAMDIIGDGLLLSDEIMPFITLIATLKIPFQKYIPQRLSVQFGINCDTGEIKVYPNGILTEIFGREFVENKLGLLCLHTALNFLDNLNNKDVGICKVNIKQKIKTGKSKRFHKIKEIIVIDSDRPVYQKVFGRNVAVDWSHGWAVRGHWRKLKEGIIGKNREGNYNIKGFTWVTPHTKKDELGIIEKTRLLK